MAMRACRLLLVRLLPVLALGCLPQPPVVVLSPEPRAVVVDDVFGFGEVPIGAVVRHRFTIENRGRKPLTIVAARSGCECATTVLPGGTIAAGDSGWADVVFDTARSPGDRLRTVTLETNDPHRPELVLSLSGRVRPDVRVSPDHVFFGRVPVGAARTRVVDIGTEPGITVLKVKKESRRIELRVEQAEAGLQLHVRLRPQAVRGPFDDTVVVTTTSERQATIEVPVLGVVD